MYKKELDRGTEELKISTNSPTKFYDPIEIIEYQPHLFNKKYVSQI